MLSNRDIYTYGTLKQAKSDNARKDVVLYKDEEELIRVCIFTDNRHNNEKCITAQDKARREKFVIQLIIYQQLFT